ncbi:Auxin-responsive GH3 family protein [Perilla frutescens var. hirtella]|uniref:Auxin-responsive GH3 family protein n=1 Tax=Perilla frutescens var. hirtella TaxID=608512 RepID=A0AAD4JIB8_PERFH|nr:Auxin-responsive GH3 family protein [Perilla frutescens var. hirtella]
MDAKALELIEEMSVRADEVQQNTLAEILSQNEGSEYLKGFNLAGATDRETFKSKVPVISYEDIQPFIRRIADGDRSPILCAQPITELLISTGTSGGQGKLIPTTQEDQDRRAFFGSLVNPILKQYVEGLEQGKSLRFMFVKPDRKTQGGLVARSSLTRFLKNPATKNRFDVMGTTSPYDAVCCEDIFQSMYAQMLYGLYDRHQVVRVGALFASGLTRAIGFLQLNWQQLAHDIRTGSLHPKVDDGPIRECLSQVLRPEPELAEFLARECGKDSWEGIIARIWPNAKFLDAIVTGSMSQYIPTLDYFSGGLPITCTLYASTECFAGINLNPFCNPSDVSYMIMPNMAYFEFLPLQPDSEPVDLVSVEIGKEYELVVTTYSGLYRYLVGDAFRVTGFHNSAPQFRFLMRKNVLLSIDTDKTDEATLQAAVENAYELLSQFKTVVVDYTSYVDTSTIPGHYVIFWELLAKDSNCMPSDGVIEQCCLAMEEAMDAEYRRCRVVDKSVGPLEIRVVKKGSFEELMDYAVAKGSAAFSQYKVPKCVKLKPMVDILDSQLVSKHFSPSPPQWESEERL